MECFLSIFLVLIVFMSLAGASPPPDVTLQAVGEVPQGDVTSAPDQAASPQPSAPPLTSMDQISGYANVGFESGGEVGPNIPPPLGSQSLAPQPQSEPPTPE